MRTFNGAHHVITAFDAQVYTQEKQLIKVKVDAGTTCTSVYLWTSADGSSTSPLAVYSLDSNKEVVIDMTDYLASVKPITVWVKPIYSGGSYETISCAYAGLINPKNLHLPPTPYNAVHKTIDIVAPLVMYKSGVVSSLVEFRGYFDENDSLRTPGTYKSFVNGSNEIPASWNIINVELEQEVCASIPMRDIACGALKACVEWVGATGAVKRCVWPICKHTIKAADSVSLAAVVGDYREMKGREDSAIIYLENLSRYDYAYYADIITSTDVRVLIGDDIASANISNGRINEAFRVKVDSSSVTIPDGDAEFNKLEVNIRVKKYGAVAL